MQPNTIYTVGYQRWTPVALQATCAELGAALLDIRYSPRSQRPEWCKDALRAVMGAAYRHEPGLGNRNYKGGAIELAAPGPAMDRVEKELARGPVVLLCVCADVHVCHRKVAAEFLAEWLGNPVVHLDSPARRRVLELPPLTFTGIALDYWRYEVTHACAASLTRLAAICAARGASYDATVRGVRG